MLVVHLADMAIQTAIILGRMIASIATPAGGVQVVKIFNRSGKRLVDRASVFSALQRRFQGPSLPLELLKPEGPPNRRANGAGEDGVGMGEGLDR